MGFVNFQQREDPRVKFSFSYWCQFLIKFGIRIYKLTSISGSFTAPNKISLWGFRIAKSPYYTRCTKASSIQYLENVVIGNWFQRFYPKKIFPWETRHIVSYRHDGIDSRFDSRGNYWTSSPCFAIFRLQKCGLHGHGKFWRDYTMSIFFIHVILLLDIDLRGEMSCEYLILRTFNLWETVTQEQRKSTE